MELNRKTTGIVIICAASVIGLVLIVMSFLKDSSQVQEDGVRNVYIEHPDADARELEESKLEAYSASRGRSSVEDYWDSIESDFDQEDPLSDISGTTQDASSGSGMGMRSLNDLKARTEKSQDDFFSNAAPFSGGSSSAAASSQPVRRSADERMAEYMAMRQQIIDQYAESMPNTGAQPQEAAVETEPVPVDEVVQEEPVVISAEPAQVRRSGSVSSLDDDVFGTISGGISSLEDENDVWAGGAERPIRCMFVREEKLESGQRVSVRLLEDMVVNGVLIPRNTHLMATCTIGQRLNLKVSSIEMNGSIYSLNYDAYDNDGAKGIYCPDIDDSAKETVRQGGTSIGRRSLTKMGNIAGEIANIGITVAESISGATKRSVRVPSGYTFYLIEGKN